jgi:hypothetical protein
MRGPYDLVCLNPKTFQKFCLKGEEGMDLWNKKLTGRNRFYKFKIMG